MSKRQRDQRRRNKRRTWTEGDLALIEVRVAALRKRLGYVTCPTCGGRGEVFTDWVRPEQLQCWLPCPDCHGKGVSDQPPTPKDLAPSQGDRT